MQFLENAKNIKAMVIMVQEEVAYRLSAKESTSDYGAITVAINLRGKAEIVLRVPREKFTPAPNVDSAVVTLGFDDIKTPLANEDVIHLRTAVTGLEKYVVEKRGAGKFRGVTGCARAWCRCRSIRSCAGSPAKNYPDFQ